MALGKFAAQSLLRTNEPITRLRGREYRYRNAVLMPTYHPAFLLRNPSAKRDVWEDMKRVREILANRDPAVDVPGVAVPGWPAVLLLARRGRDAARVSEEVQSTCRLLAVQRDRRRPTSFSPPPVPDAVALISVAVPVPFLDLLTYQPSRAPGSRTGGSAGSSAASAPVSSPAASCRTTRPPRPKLVTRPHREGRHRGSRSRSVRAAARHRALPLGGRLLHGRHWRRDRDGAASRRQDARLGVQDPARRHDRARGAASSWHTWPRQEQVSRRPTPRTSLRRVSPGGNEPRWSCWHRRRGAVCFRSCVRAGSLQPWCRGSSSGDGPSSTSRPTSAIRSAMPLRRSSRPLERELTSEQARAFEALSALAGAGAFRVALVHGVTGSGKTELYLRLADTVRRSGRRVLLLVPEIALTPSMVALVRSALGNRVAIQHSGLSAGERHDQWQRIRRGDVDVVVGTRSAVFAPLERLGLIVVDEEHDASYKQDETPRYHGRDVAILRGSREGALVVLGSATPSLESYQHAVSGSTCDSP